MKSIPLKSIIILLAQDFIPDQFQQSARRTLGPQACQEGREGTHNPTILVRLTPGEPGSPMANQHFKGVLSPFIAVWIQQPGFENVFLAPPFVKLH